MRELEAAERAKLERDWDPHANVIAAMAAMWVGQRYSPAQLNPYSRTPTESIEINEDPAAAVPPGTKVKQVKARVRES